MESGTIAAVSALFVAASLAPLVSAYDGPAYIDIPEGISECENEGYVDCLQMTSWIMPAGTTARWVNFDSVEHWFSVFPITESINMLPFDTGKIQPSRWMDHDFNYNTGRPFDYGFEYVFAEAGLYQVSCLIHPWIYHTIEVTSKNSTSAPESETIGAEEDPWAHMDAEFVALSNTFEIVDGPDDVQVGVTHKTAKYVHEIHKREFHVVFNGSSVDFPIECHFESYDESGHPTLNDWEVQGTRQNVTGSVAWDLPVGRHSIICGANWTYSENLSTEAIHTHFVDVLPSLTDEQAPKAGNSSSVQQEEWLDYSVYDEYGALVIDNWCHGTYESCDATEKFWWNMSEYDERGNLDSEYWCYGIYAICEAEPTSWCGGTYGECLLEAGHVRGDLTVAVYRELEVGSSVDTLGHALMEPVPVAKGDSMTNDRLVVIETASGTFTIELFDDEAPNHASNMRRLADSGYYDGTLFHRIISGFMIQGGDGNTREGDPSTWGQGGKAYGPDDTVDAEFNDIMHVPGIVSAARKGGDPDSASSQFFVVHGDATFLDGQYTVFGRIVTEESYRALEAIAALGTGAGDRPVDTEAARIHSAYTVARSEAAGVLELGEPERAANAVTGGVPEERTEAALVTPADLEDGVYRNARLGVSFEPPAGWSVQVLPTPKPGPEVPDLVVVGPENDGLPPVISLDVQPAVGRTLGEYLEHRNSFRASAVESGELEIEGAKGAEINGRAALAQGAAGTLTSQGTEWSIAFREVATESGGRFYALTYMAEAGEFEGGMGLFEGVLGTFTVPADAGGGAPAAGDSPRAKGDGPDVVLFTSRDYEQGFGLVMSFYGSGLGDDDALRAIKYFHDIGAMAFDIGAGDGIGEAPARPVCGPGWPVGSALAVVAFGNHDNAQKRHCLELLAEQGHFSKAALGF